MRLEIAPLTECSSLDLDRLAKAIQAEFGRRIRGTISLALVDNRTIRALNRKYLGRRGDTDVLSFPLDSGLNIDPERVFGEVVVSIEMAGQEADARSIPLFEEVLRYCVHGLLHLLGYEDRTASEAKEMNLAVERIVARHAGRKAPEGCRGKSKRRRPSRGKEANISHREHGEIQKKILATEARRTRRNPAGTIKP